MALVGLVLLLTGLVLFGVGVIAPLLLPAPRASQTRLPLVDGVPLRVVVPAYLEASVIKPTVVRLNAQLAAFAPAGSDVLVVASDDATARAAEEAGARVMRTEPSGKVAAVNAGVRASAGHIVVLTDGNCQLSPDSWPDLLAQTLKDAALVSGVKTENGGSEAAFWAFERRVRTFEKPQPTLSTIGEFLAFRAEHFEELAPTLSDDLMMAISFDQRGLPVVADPRITTQEEATTGDEQWMRRVRIARGQLTEVSRRLGTVRLTSAGRTYLWHKFYRLTVGCFGFWIAVIGVSLLSFPFTLVLAGAAIFAALTYYLKGKGRLWPPLQAVVTGVALQCVVPAALLQVALAPKKDRGGWKKVHR